MVKKQIAIVDLASHRYYQGSTTTILPKKWLIIVRESNIESETKTFVKEFCSINKSYFYCRNSGRKIEIRYSSYVPSVRDLTGKKDLCSEFASNIVSFSKSLNIIVKVKK